MDDPLFCHLFSAPLVHTLDGGDFEVSLQVVLGNEISTHPPPLSLSQPLEELDVDAERCATCALIAFV